MTETLTKLSEALADVVEEASPSVVRVEGRRRLAATGMLWSDDGLVVTANHVVKRDNEVNVGLSSGESVAATIVGRDPTTDLAVLRIENQSDILPSWQDDADLKVGQIVLALGRPGNSIQATLGVISALGPYWRTPAGGELTRYLQTDVVMYPGFSGGPLVNSEGKFAGLNTSALVRGVSVTVPSASIASVVEDLVEHGMVRRGYLGVSLQIVRLPGGMRSELNQKSGLLIAGMEDGSPASRSELLQGDILVSIEGVPLRNMDDLFVQLRGDRIGSTMLFRIIRAGQLLEVEVEIGSRESG